MAADHSSSQAPPAFAPALSRLEAWRSRPDRGRSIPEGIWDSAAQLAASHGVYRVSQELGLNYHSLKKRVGLGAASRASTSFIEIPLVPRGGAAGEEARVEVESPKGWKVMIPASLARELGRAGVGEILGALPS